MARPDMSLKSGITFQHPAAFWVGTGLVAFGVLAHFPDFVASAPMRYRMAGMPMSALMLAGMFAIVAGLILAGYGLIPFGKVLHSADHSATSGIHFKAMDSAHLTAQHWGLLFVLGIALIVDVMKPATLGFSVPGMRSEYAISTKVVSYFPLIALTGTTIGSLVWGALSDRIGRRAAILLASILFMATSICGFMPSFKWNLFMCFIMGLSAGGMLPIVYALMTESMPSQKRGWLVVLHGGMGTIGGYLAASALAAFLEPHFSWRILWFAGLPTGLLMLVLNRWIPESPRFLLEQGRVDEAERVMKRYGVRVSREPDAVIEEERAQKESGSMLSMFRGHFLPQTVAVGMYAFGWGLVNWGFITFTPTILRDRGVDGASTSRLLFWSALVSVPATVLVAYLYGMWSSRRTMILFAMVTVLALVGFVVIDPGSSPESMRYLLPLMVLLLIGTGGIISMLSPYTAEVYPTRLRGTGSGFAAGASKVGGIIAPQLVVILITIAPGFRAVGFAAAIPVAVSALILAFVGMETRDRGLEELSRSHATPALERIPEVVAAEP
jgi:putative MFS transporter